MKAEFLAVVERDNIDRGCLRDAVNAELRTSAKYVP